MKITETIPVDRAIDDVWALFQDVPALAACLPGAELLEVRDGGTFVGRVTVKLGPITATFDGEATVEADAPTRSGVVHGRGTDRRGGSRGRVTVAYRVVPVGGGTEVTVDADVHLSGPVAQFGRTGLVKELSRRLIDEFVHCIEARLATDGPGIPADSAPSQISGGSLLLSSLWATVVRFLKRLVGR